MGNPADALIIKKLIPAVEIAYIFKEASCQFFYNVYVSRCVCGNRLVIGCARVADVKLARQKVEKICHSDALHSDRCMYQQYLCQVSRKFSEAEVGY